MSQQRSSQKGVFHIQSLLVFVLVIGVISAAGYFVLNKSRAGTNPYSNGMLTDGYNMYQNVTSAGTYASQQSYIVAAEAGLTDCNGSTSGYGSRQTWSTTSYVLKCSQVDYTTGLHRLSLVSMKYDNTSPVLLKKDQLLATGTISALGAYTIDSQSFIKNGSMSKIALIDSTGDGVNEVHKIGIYDVDTKTTNYIKDSSGKQITSTTRLHSVDWTPDNTKLYLLQDDYRDGNWRFKVCSVLIAGGDLKCVTPKGQSDLYDQTGNGDPIWSYDLSSLYYRSNHLDQNNKVVSSIYKYSTSYNTITKIIDGGNYAVNNLSPDDRYLLVTNIIDGAPWQGKVFDTKSNTFTSSPITNTWNLSWQALKNGTVAVTIPPDSGPILNSNYSVSCTATYGKIARDGTMPITVKFTNAGPDPSPTINTGFVSMGSATGTIIAANTAVPSISSGGSYTWVAKVGSFGKKTTYNLAAGYKNDVGTVLANCAGTKTFTTR